MSIITSHDFPPIPSRDMDWSAHFDWDEGGANLRGFGPSEESAVLDLLRKAVDADGDGSEQEEVVDLAIAGWQGAQRFHNALRIMYSLDEVDQVLAGEKVSEFHANPLRAALHMDRATWAKVHALIEARQPKG